MSQRHSNGRVDAKRGPRARCLSSAQQLNVSLAHEACERGAGVALHGPAHVSIQAASACNLDCYMCSEHLRPEGTRFGRDAESMSPEIFERIEREIFPTSSLVTFGVGGEPMISERFLEYVERAYDAGQEVHVVTNGTRIHRDEVARTLTRCVSHLQWSIDGATQATYERIRLGSKWARIQSNLERLNRFRLEYPPETRQHLTLCMVLMKSNVHELEAMVELAHLHSAEAVHAQHVIPVTSEGARESLIEEPERYNRCRAAAVERAAELGIELKCPAPYRLPVGEPPGDSSGAAEVAGSVETQPVPCTMPTLEVYVFYDGRVFPCCHPHAHQTMQVGDLRTQSFLEIWNGDLYRLLRRGMRAGDVPAICRSCSIVHDPPTAYEGGAADGMDLRGYYADREPEPDATETLQAYRTIVAQRLRARDDDVTQHESHISSLKSHISNLESERPHLLEHIATLETERARMKHIMRKTRAMGTFKFLGGIKSLFVRK